MNFSFNIADADYCDFLREQDNCVPFTRGNKSTRPFVGIVYKVNDYKYYAPLSSPKPKHIHMKNKSEGDLTATRLHYRKSSILPKGEPVMVYVLNREGQPLMPTNRHGKVRHLVNYSHHL